MGPQLEPNTARYHRFLIAAAVLFGGALFLLQAKLFLFPLLRQHSGSLVMVEANGKPVSGGAPSVVSAPSIGGKPIDQRLTEASATTGGDLEISLAWNSLTDLDLQVRDPSGEVISASHPHSASGGTQDVDANPTLLTVEGQQRYASGQIPGADQVIPFPEQLLDLQDRIGMPDGIPGITSTPSLEGKAASRFSRTPVEHIYFNRPPQGTYAVLANCFSWREKSREPLPFTIQVRTHGRIFYQTTGTLGPANYVADGARPVQVCQFAFQ